MTFGLAALGLAGTAASELVEGACAAAAASVGAAALWAGAGAEVLAAGASVFLRLNQEKSFIWTAAKPGPVFMGLVYWDPSAMTGRAMTPILLQAAQDPDLGAVLALVFLLQVACAVGFGIWIARDAKRRDMKPAPWTVALVVSFLLVFLSGFIILFLYLSVRSAPNPYLPPPTQAAYHPPGSGWATPPAAPEQAARAPPRHTAAPGTAASKVKCPRCQNVFEFIRQPQGPTHVKCPACGMEGTI